MTTLDETKFHWFSMDSATDLTGLDLDLSLDETTWVTAEETTAPDNAATLPAPVDGTRYWWRLLIGPDGGDLELTDGTTLIYGRIEIAGETLRPSWTIYAEDDVTDDVDCWPIIPCGDTWTSHSAEVQSRAEHAATTTLRVLTGYRVGGCPVRLRPTATPRCRHNKYRAYPVYGPAYSWPLSGGYLSWCSCRPGILDLPGEASAVTEVKVDGATLTAGDDYRLLDGRLYRVDGTWPTSNNLALEDTEEGTWSVTYQPTIVPDEQAQHAAGLLACEWAKAFSGKSCALPAGTKSVSRAGVSFDIVTGLFPDGVTGIREVDAFILRWNPHGLRTASRGIDPSRYAGSR